MDTREAFIRLMHTKYQWKHLESISLTPPMLAAIVKVADIMDKDVFLSQMQASYEHKFAKKPEVIDGNMRALKMAFEEVK